MNMTRQCRSPVRALQAVQLTRRALSLGAKQKYSEFAPFLAIVLKLRPTTVLEIGRGSGGSLWALCHAAAEHGTIVSVDLPAGPFGGEDLSVETLERLRTFACPHQCLHLIQSDSHAPETVARVRALIPRIDLLFIDGDHTYEGVKVDYHLYSQLVPTGGIVAFHDVLHHPTFPECQVDRFWEELRGRKFVITSSSELDANGGQWGGIGILEMD